ncbi:MAG: DUF6049 family protein, partial [Ilumatobacteraceae bacterium]
PAAPAAGATGRLELVSLSFDVAANGGLALDLRLPADLSTDPDARLVITAHRPVESRRQVAEAIDGTLPRNADSVDLDGATLAHPAADRVRTLIPVERSTRTAAALQLARPGLYPISVELTRRGETVADLVTFVHRLPDADEEDEQPIRVAVLMGTDHDVEIDPDTLDRPVIDDAALAELSRLADSLESSAVPVAVSLSPAVAAALAEAGPEAAAVAERLRALLPDHLVLPTTLWPMSPSQAADADLATTYGRWLRDGEDALAELAGTTPDRAVLVVDDALTAAGGALLRDLGARLLVLPVDRYDDLPGSLGGFTDSTQLVQLGVDDDTTIDGVIVDRVDDDQLSHATSAPLQTAIEIAADLVAAREEISIGGGEPSRHSVLLATTQLGVIPAELLGPLTEVLSSTPSLDIVTVDDLSARTDQLLIDGTEVVIPLDDARAAGDGDTIADRVALASAVVLDAASTGSMLPTDDPRLDEWQRRIELLPTSALDDDEAAAVVADIAAQLADVRNSIDLPRGFSFTLTGRRTDIPVKLFNSSDTPLTVVVRLTSTKLATAGSPTVTLPPREYTDVLVPIEARSNGRFPVTLEVLTPLGEVPLGDAVPLEARVGALRGLGPLLTGALLLVLLSWWVRHVRELRRVRFASAHPSGRAYDTRAPRHDDDPAAVEPPAPDVTEGLGATALADLDPESGGDQR